ncbi:hypothetical protein [Massilia sp. BSC265]|uniref:hypothetical protein n=1 Tax=Massilia sp. BSC265 TaxID=1549812 RepID=UPI0004E877E6|nr:hypothetical protein [Massilia sp. BSC265]KFI09098.1 hypothetical protein JN27_00175 [Massilia sp. BSC265]
MSTRATIWLAILTAAYLALELGFNARLVDALGGHVSLDEVHHLENHGRALSGAAVALLLLQLAVYFRRRVRAFTHGMGAFGYWIATTALCGAAAVGVSNSLEDLAERLVDRSSGEFRRASMTAVLAKAAMVDGVVRLGGLSSADEVASKPEGKAFLALFPLFAGSMASLESAFAPEKKRQVRRLVEQEMGGAAAYYAGYRKAIEKTHARWRDYDRADHTKVQARLAQSIRAEQDKAWAQYLRDLGRRGWSPYTVPYDAQDRVRAKVRARVPVPDDWDLGDEDGFRQAVARKAQDAAGRRLDTRAVRINGGAVPLGLGWEQFLAHPAVQAELREGLRLPRNVVVQPRYPTGEAFRRIVFDPAVELQFRKQWIAYEADGAQLGNGGRYEKQGREAAQAVIVPPLALLFSLLGALTHMTKLACMLSSVALRQSADGSRYIGRVMAGIVAMAVAGTISLCYLDNEFTRSPGYLLLENRIAHSDHAPWRAWAMARTLHGVAVGQGLFFPVNEAIRTRLLFNLTYGFDPQDHVKD